jgi:hypothetical protein
MLPWELSSARLGRKIEFYFHPQSAVLHQGPQTGDALKQLCLIAQIDRLGSCLRALRPTRMGAGASGKI